MDRMPHSRVEILELLLAVGADVNAQSKGYAAFWAASLRRHHKTRELLLKAGGRILRPR